MLTKHFSMFHGLQNMSELSWEIISKVGFHWECQWGKDIFDILSALLSFIWFARLKEIDMKKAVSCTLMEQWSDIKDICDLKDWVAAATRRL